MQLGILEFYTCEYIDRVEVQYSGKNINNNEYVGSF